MTAGTECSEGIHTAGFTLLARRNNSLTSAARALILALILVVPFTIAAAFAAFGAWLVLPFAGLEMLALYCAFRHIERHAGDYELIAVDGERVRVERFEAGRLQRHEFNRYWAQVVAAPDGSRLALRSHGREIEIGHHMNEEQRLAAARELKRRLRAATQ
ncbi:MAG TPA: DUF2244 domain-containing protein [Burkholderiales bacterium]|nr:DUF2244 domain-containing protein [Burkholderiales bacterium]